MKKLQFIIFLLFSSLVLSQSWYKNEDTFENSNNKVYDNLYKKKEREINQETENIKKTFSNAESIVKFFQDENLPKDNKDNPSFGPGSPGEPVPIGNYSGLLFLIGLMLIVYNKKLIRSLTKEQKI